MLMKVLYLINGLILSCPSLATVWLWSYIAGQLEVVHVNMRVELLVWFG